MSQKKGKAAQVMSPPTLAGQTEKKKEAARRRS